jgi:hypothetical protein
MPSYYPYVRAVRYYKGAYTIDDLMRLPSYITQWALTAEAAEASGQEMAREMARQEAELHSS